MADYFNKKQKNGMGSLWDDEKESTADILYPTMRNMKHKTSSFADVLSGNSSSEKKKSGTLLGESIYDDDDDFKDLKFDFNALSDKPKDDWKSKQIKDEDERIAKLKRTADILYGKTTPEHGPNWIGNKNIMSKTDDDLDDFDNSVAKNSDSDNDEDDILDLMFPSMANLKSKNKSLSSLKDEIKSQTSSDSAKVSDNDDEYDILDLMYPSMRSIQSKFKTGIKSKNDNEQASEIKDEIGKATSSKLPKFAPEKKDLTKSTAKNEKTGFDSGMKIPDFDKTFDEGFDFDKTDDKPGNETEEQENDFPSEISDKKKKSDKDGIVTGGAAGDKDSNDFSYLNTKTRNVLENKGITLNFDNITDNKIKNKDIKKLENTEINIDNSKKLKIKEIVPGIDKYISDNIIKTYSRLETDINLFKKLYPYYEQRVNQELSKNQKLTRLNKEFYLKSGWKIVTQQYMSLFKDIYNIKGELTEAAKMKEFIEFLENDKKHPEIIQEMLNDFINGGDLSFYAASYLGKIPDAAGLLRINGKDSDLNIRYTDKAIKYNSSKDLPLKYKSVIDEKLHSQKLNPDSKGLFFNSDSDFSKRIAKSKEIQNKIIEIGQEIPLFYDYKSKNYNKCYSINLKSVEFKNDNLYYALHNADIRNLKIDMFGNISGDIIDTTDFNDGKKEPKLIKEAKKLQDKGIIEPKFIIVHFVIPKKIVKEIYKNGKRNNK